MNFLRRMGVVAGLVGTAGMLVLAGCKFFEPTRPELPKGSAIVARLTEPETTLVTIALAIVDKSSTNGQAVYAECFADTAIEFIGYHAFFDPLTVARFEGQSTEWDRDREQIFYANLSRQQPGLQFLFTWGAFPGAPNDVIETSSALLYRSYELLATPDNSTYVPVAKGLADLYFIKSNSKWKLYRWQDHEDPHADFQNGERSFGHLRLAGP